MAWTEKTRKHVKARQNGPFMMIVVSLQGWGTNWHQTRCLVGSYCVISNSNCNGKSVIEQMYLVPTWTECLLFNIKSGVCDTERPIANCAASLHETFLCACCLPYLHTCGEMRGIGYFGLFKSIYYVYKLMWRSLVLQGRRLPAIRKKRIWPVTT